jgi:site-specific DNA recombinase
MRKRAVLYARVSSEDRSRDGRNLQGQLELCKEYALKRGWRIVGELAEDDRGASGASFELPQLNRIYEMARAGEFDILVVREIDRLSRRLAKQLIVEEELKRCGIQIEYVLGEYPDTPEGSLMKNVKASIAEYERLKITERMVRGRRQKAKAGNVLMHGHIPFGYRQEERDGKTMLIIHEPEAQVVRLMFQWYVVGSDGKGPMSIHGVTRELNKMGVPTPYDNCKNVVKLRGYGEWSNSVVGRMLSNETYAGTWYYGKGKHVDQQYTKNPESYRIPVTVPAIVDRATWEQAQARKKQNRKDAKRNRKWHYLLTGHLTCGDCGLKMFGRTTRRVGEKVYQYYTCPGGATNQSPRPCNLRPFRVDQTDAAVWGWIKSILTDPKALAEGLNTYHAALEKKNAPMKERLKVVDQLLANDRQQLERLLDLYLSGDFPRDALVERKNRLETTITALEAEQTSLASHLEAQVLTEEQIQALQDFTAEVAEGLQAAEEDFETRRRIIRMLNVQVTLAEEDGQKVVYVRCMVGEDVLSIATHST